MYVVMFDEAEPQASDITRRHYIRTGDAEVTIINSTLDHHTRLSLGGFKIDDGSCCDAGEPVPALLIRTSWPTLRIS